MKKPILSVCLLFAFNLIVAQNISGKWNFHSILTDSVETGENLKCSLFVAEDKGIGNDSFFTSYKTQFDRIFDSTRFLLKDSWKAYFYQSVCTYPSTGWNSYGYYVRTHYLDSSNLSSDCTFKQRCDDIATYSGNGIDPPYKRLCECAKVLSP